MYKLNSVSKQRGTVLVLALLLLFVMTLIGVSTMTTSTMEERMSGNANDRQVALQSAESTLRDAEKFIQTNIKTVSNFTNNGGTKGLYALGKGPVGSDAFDYSTWWASSKPTQQYTGKIQSGRAVPLYVIEHRGPIVIPNKAAGQIYNRGGTPPPGVGIESFRITTRANGITNNSVVIIQSHWAQNLN